MNGSNFSEFYLERVGHEANGRLSKQLKEGKNLVGRELDEVDIAINSFHCSRRHCVITVSGNSVELEDLNKLNGTTVNGVKRKGETVKLQELDIIGVVGGSNAPQTMIGNYCFFVYRLRRQNSNNSISIAIDDNDAVVISDDESNEQRVDNEIVCLDLVDSDEELDLDIHLSELFNIEIKRELEDLDDFDEICKQLKKEPSDFFEIETIDQYQNEVNNIATCDQLPASDGVDNCNSAPAQPDSDDSTDTVPFSTTATEDNNLSMETIDFECTEAETTSPAHYPSESANHPDELSEHSNESSKCLNQSKDHLNKSFKNGVNEALPNDQLDLSDRSSDHIESEDKLQRTITKVSEQAKRKQGPEIIAAKPIEKRRKTRIFDNEQVGRPKLETSVNKEYIKDKLKSISTTKPKVPVEEKLKVKNLAHVKNTIGNRGSFLTDPTQIPVLPKDIKKLTAVSKPLMTRRSTGDEPVASSSHQSDSLEISPLSIEPSSSDSKSFAGTSTEYKQLKYQNEEKVSTTPINKPFSSLKKLSFSDLSKPNAVSHSEKTKKEENFKGDGFQFDPRHKIISELTSYDFKQHKTVESFCNSFNKNISPFVDTYTDHMEYQRTLVGLMMAELRKEIEIEFANSQILDFISVGVNYQNLEKRGDGRRMVFHCQADSLYKSQSIADGHLVFVRCEGNEFLALISNISYSSKSAENKLAHFTMETSAITETLTTQSLEIRPVTVIANTLNSFSAICNLKNSPLLNLVLNPLCSSSEPLLGKVTYKGCDLLDKNQKSILKTIYKRCTKLNVPNISLLDGAAGTGKTRMIVNLALQLVYGDNLPKPLRILICSKSNRNTDEIAVKLMNIRDKTCAVNTKIQLVRFGTHLEHMDAAVRRISVQHLKQTDELFLKFADLDNLRRQEETLRLKVLSLTFSLGENRDSSDELKLWKSKHIKVSTLKSRLESLEKKKLRDAATVILNACDIICTTLGSITKLQNFVPNVDVCIIDEATQCNEPLTLLPFRFGMPSLVLVGDSQLLPPTPYSPIANGKNYGKSLFERFQKLFLGKLDGPVFDLSTQHRMPAEVLTWPNSYFYKNRLNASVLKTIEYFPIMPYKVISYNPIRMETDNVMLLINVLLRFVDTNKHSIGIICTNFKQNSIMQNKLREHPNITTNTIESYVTEKDVVIIWISKEHGMCHLVNQRLLNLAITRAKKALFIFGTELLAYKSRPAWKSLLENAQERKCFHHFKPLTETTLISTISKSV